MPVARYPLPAARCPLPAIAIGYNPMCPTNVTNCIEINRLRWRQRQRFEYPSKARTFSHHNSILFESIVDCTFVICYLLFDVCCFYCCFYCCFCFCFVPRVHQKILWHRCVGSYAVASSWKAVFWQRIDILRGLKRRRLVRCLNIIYIHHYKQQTSAWFTELLNCSCRLQSLHSH